MGQNNNFSIGFEGENYMPYNNNKWSDSFKSDELNSFE